MGSASSVIAQQARLPIEIHVKTIDHDAIRGRLVSLSFEQGLTVDAERGQRQTIPIADLVRISTAITVATRPSQGVKLELVGGDELFGRILGGQEDAIVMETEDLGKIAVPLEAVVGYVRTPARSSAEPRVLEWFGRVKQDGEDLILLLNGDIIRGFITAIESGGVTVDRLMGETKVPSRLIAAVRLAVAQPPTPQSPYVVITFQNSGRLTITDLQLEGLSGDITLSSGAVAHVETDRIALIEVVGGRWSWLGLRRPISTEHTPMLSLGWNHVRDRNVLGQPIVISGETFRHGIGVHSRSNLIYDLKGSYRQFVTYFGLDDNSGRFADVDVYVLVDGIKRFEQIGVRPGRLYGPVQVNVEQAKRIELIVDFGLNGDIQDRFNWIEPALVK